MAGILIPAMPISPHTPYISRPTLGSDPYEQRGAFAEYQ
jgi:hypothetical protein